MKSGSVLHMLLTITVLSIPFTVSAETVGGGDLIFTPTNTASVLFSHDKHVITNKIKCSGCHYLIFPMEHSSNKMQMDKIAKGNFCGKCHNGQKAFSVNEKQNCSRCHHS